MPYATQRTQDNLLQLNTTYYNPSAIIMIEETSANQLKWDSIRPQEQQYQKEVRETYSQLPHLFLTHSSDTLHLTITTLTIKDATYQTLLAKNGYEKYDLIAEVRGSVIKTNKLQLLLQEKTVQQDQLPLLLSLGSDSGLLISPKNITKYLFNRRRMSSQQEESSNCYIEAHFGRKLFICASRTVGKGEELVVDQQSLQKFLLSFKGDEMKISG